MSVNNAAYPHPLDFGASAPYYTSIYTSRYDPGTSPSDALVPRSHRSVGQDPHRYHTQDTVETVTQHRRNTAGHSDQSYEEIVGAYDPIRNYYDPTAPSLGSRVSESPMYHADPYDVHSTGRIPYGQPPGAVAPYGVTRHIPGAYANERKKLYEGQQSDDDYQRHNADRNRREGRAQDRFGQRNQRASRVNEYFLNGEGLHVDVLQREVCRFLGPEASVTPVMSNGIHGFMIKARRHFTQAMIHDLQIMSTEYNRDACNVSPEYRMDTRSLGNSLSKAAGPQAIDREESWIYI